MTMTSTESCPICGGGDLRVAKFDGQIRARDGTQLPYHANHSTCNDCGEEFFTKRQSRESNRAAAAALRVHAGLLTPEEIVAIRTKYRITQTELQRILRSGKKTAVRWESGVVCQSQAIDQLLRELRDSPNRFYELAEAAGVTVRPVEAPVYVVQSVRSVRVTQGKNQKPWPRRRSRQSSVFRVVVGASTVTVTRGFPVTCFGGV